MLLLWTAAASSSPQVVSVMNAGKGMYYLQIFDSKTLSPTCEAQMLPLQDICAQLNGIHAALTGNAAAEALANTPQASTLSAQHAVAYPHALYIAQLAMHQHMAGGIATSQPLYIRQPDAKLPNSI